MKKQNTITQTILYLIALSILPMLFLALGPAEPVAVPGPAMDSALTTLSAATSLSGTDVMYVVVSGNSRKMAWSDLMAQIRDSIETRRWFTTGQWEWTGGEFNLGSAGTVNFYDTVIVNASAGVFVIEGNAKQLIYGDMQFISGAKLLIPPKGIATTFTHLGYAGSDGASYVVFNYGTSLTDSLATLRYLRTADWQNDGIGMVGGCDSTAMAAGSQGYPVTTRTKVFDGNASASSATLDVPIYDGQRLTIICAASDTHGFTLLDTDGECELISDANKSFTAGDVMELVGYNGIWYQAAAIAAN